MTMRRSILAVTPAIWLALSGAAQPQQIDAIRQLSECRLDPDKALAAIDTLKVSNTREAEDGQRTRIIRAYQIPAGLKVFGAVPVELGSLETLEAGQDRIMIITSINGPAAPFEAAALAANGKSACVNQEDSARKTCNVNIRDTPSGRVTLLVAQNGETTDIACSYQRS